MNVDDSMATEASELATSSVPLLLSVEQGLILPPEVLQTALPEVASAVNNAIRSSMRIRQAPFYLRMEVPTTQQGKLPPTYKQISTQKNNLTLDSPQIKKNTQNLRQYQRKFICYTCYLKFPTKKDLNTHNQQCNQLNHPLKCAYCKIDYSTKKQLQDHQCMFCKICDKLYSYRSEYVTHFRRYHYTPTFSCFACDEHFINNDALTVYDQSYVAFYAHCPKCNRRFTSFLCYKCAKFYPNMNDLSKHSHDRGLEHMCRICNAEFEHDLDLASHMRKHSSTVKSYTKKMRKISEKTKDNVETQEIKEPDSKVEQNVNVKWFDSGKERFYEGDGKNELIGELENDRSADAVKQEPGLIEVIENSDEVKIEADELGLNTEHSQSNKLDEKTIDGVKKEPDIWPEYTIEPREIHFVSQVQIQKHHRTIIIEENTNDINEEINKSFNNVKVEPSESNEETEFLEEASTSIGPCMVKQKAPEVLDGFVKSEPCLARVKTEST